jgi:8-oxo-dGTP pyrophosphatase MutT (NUDIX family)
LEGRIVNPPSPALSNDVSLPDLLANRLQRRLPGRAAQQIFAHELSYGRHFGPPSYDAVPAAVLIALIQHQGKWQLPLILRPVSLTTHGGQVCLPGGRIDRGESCQSAALREADEELGLRPSIMTILGNLSPVYLYVSNHLVTPSVAVCHAQPHIKPNRSEVEELIWLPIDVLVNPRHRGMHHHRHVSGVDFQATHFQVGKHRVWGATAMILSELAGTIESLN